MTRILVLAAALLASPAALACGGADCGGCAKAHTETANVDDVDAAQGTKLTFAVTGMKCGKCSAKVTAALKGVDGVNAASVDHDAGVAKVAFDPKKTNEAALLKAIEGTGFAAQKANS